MDIEIIVADYANEQHGNAIVELLNGYASGPMGGGKPLSNHVRENLIAELAKLPGAFSVLAYADSQAVGLVNCMIGFSTFKCKPLVNIHDVTVDQAFRGQKICQQMFDEVQRVAIERDCCKLTLEVLDGNHAAKKAYRNFGFDADKVTPVKGNALFWHKVIC